MGDVFTGSVDDLVALAKKQQRGDDAGQGQSAVGAASADADAVSASISIDSSTVASADGIAQSLRASAVAAGADGDGDLADAHQQWSEATTSPVPGTTVAVVETPLPNGGVLADTPGIVVNMDAYKLWERIAVHGKGPREIKSLRPLNLIKVRML